MRTILRAIESLVIGFLSSGAIARKMAATHEWYVSRGNTAIVSIENYPVGSYRGTDTVFSIKCRCSYEKMGKAC